ncbi:cytochrome P450 [Actinoallomurus soli]|uniref:cytochrome P450 n=1 Tax=Actinoallomurus soli TaxID=2952535 RepID=UPI002093B48B|nr:cytochrome P450 [Actinoallomurus soli]MCO5970832.1 cytochrome P450 [Actinoallomurus soli]
MTARGTPSDHASPAGRTADRERPPVMDFPLGPPGTMGPIEEYGRLRRECPVARVRTPMGATAWYVTRYADVRALLADARLVRPTINAWPVRPEDLPEPGPGLTTMMELDGPRHAALRRALADEFAVHTVEGRLGRVRALAEGLLDDIETGGRPADLAADFAEPFPLLVMCDLVGIPYEDRDYFLPMADVALGALVTLDEGREVTHALRGYIAELIARKRRRPGDDVLTRLVRRCDQGELDREEVICFGLSMLMAGYRTCTMFLADAILVLLTRPGRFARLRDDRGMMPRAVEELLRYLPVMNGVVVLQATRDIDLHGRAIHAGEAVLPVLAAANRDGSVFPDADRLDLRRDPNPHLTFGQGAHYCIGVHLARAELAVALDSLLDRFPGLRLAVDESELPWEDESPAKSPLAIPVEW